MPPLRFVYRTLEFDKTDIHVRTLRDRQQYEDVDGVASELGISTANWPLFGLIWPSSEVLARLMFDFDIKGKRILEVGCGIALPSLVLNSRSADITATDYHPEVEGFLEVNTAVNNSEKIPFVRTGWCDDLSTLGTFDLIIGSDLLYDRSHVEPLRDFINQHTKASCEVILVDPGRGHHASFTKKMKLLGYSHKQSAAETKESHQKAFKGQVIHYCR